MPLRLYVLLFALLLLYSFVFLVFVSSMVLNAIIFFLTICGSFF
uniref:Uncharacterized protein n=1 Tax=Arundo donax TaxID=35708 RepID=A0A0A9H4P1_ARUDO